jgi:hypothetical protein
MREQGSGSGPHVSTHLAVPAGAASFLDVRHEHVPLAAVQQCRPPDETVPVSLLGDALVAQ